MATKAKPVPKKERNCPVEGRTSIGGQSNSNRGAGAKASVLQQTTNQGTGKQKTGDANLTDEPGLSLTSQKRPRVGGAEKGANPMAA